MKKIFLIPFLLSLIIACDSSQKATVQADKYFMPAEYSPHEFVWLGWEEYAPYHQPFVDLTKALVDKVPLRIIANDSLNLRNIKSELSENGIDTLNIQFYIINDNRLWVRDHGATYVINKNGDKKVVDFGWTLYGKKEYLKTYFEGNMDSVTHQYQQDLGQTGRIDSIMGSIDHLSTIKTDVNMEGGSIEVNGKGTLILCEAVTMQRNPEKSKEYIESEFKKTLGTDNIIWMKKGLVEDPFLFNQIFDDYFGWGTYGHTDEFVRFVNDSTILLAWVDESEKNLNEFNRINFERMSENLKILENSRDQDGKSFNIIKVPLPDLIFTETTIVNHDVDWSDGENWEVPLSWLPQKGIKKVGDSIKLVAASSYLNYLVTNDLVVLPTYIQEGSSPEKEEKVKAIFTEVFPNRQLVFLNVTNLNFNGGGIHCITQQQPKNDANKK
ncbi:agmatine/peptidylarginine deiminase [Maribacter sp. ACAM166]|uniref:agmatine deiminase family protein n=1 Tax=Maribacter sp. ACAM166 TaxID=2508996 RepID=UPI0010FE5072|nr:agmatine deiminase family protein [Maribacter sp. ACAM166]TLP70541.1 agmatine deiminase family protein [Maribacter sp. ACAM166]